MYTPHNSYCRKCRMQKHLAAPFISCSPQQMLLCCLWVQWGLGKQDHSAPLFFSSAVVFAYFSTFFKPFTAEVKCGIISSLLACLYGTSQHPAPIHTSDNFTQTARDLKKKKKTKHNCENDWMIGAGGLILLKHLFLSELLQQRQKNKLTTFN